MSMYERESEYEVKCLLRTAARKDQMHVPTLPTAENVFSTQSMPSDQSDGAEQSLRHR